MRLRPLSIAFVPLLLLLGGCSSHQAALRDAPPPMAVVEAPVTEAPVAEAVATDASGAEGAAERTAIAAADAAASQDGTAEPTVASTETLSPTEAEQDFAAIYGGQEYDPIADPTLPAPAVVDTPAYDPWMKFNRRMHRFNQAIDRRIAKPLARAYVRVVPRPVRLGVSNFFDNLGQPVSALNALLQGKPKQAGQSVGRFLLNSTLGIGGLFDPATAARIPNRSEDFGQTLGTWGWKKSRYVELPLFGPRTVRDVFGMVGDAPLSPTRQIEEDRVRVFLQGLQLVEVRTQLLSTDTFREGATDDYALVRDAWLQRRNYQIFGDRERQDDSTLPDYLRNDEDDPIVPVDAMPVPGSP